MQHTQGSLLVSCCSSRMRRPTPRSGRFQNQTRERGDGMCDISRAPAGIARGREGGRGRRLGVDSPGGSSSSAAETPSSSKTNARSSGCTLRPAHPGPYERTGRRGDCAVCLPKRGSRRDGRVRCWKDGKSAGRAGPRGRKPQTGQDEERGRAIAVRRTPDGHPPREVGTPVCRFIERACGRLQLGTARRCDRETECCVTVRVC